MTETILPPNATASETAFDIAIGIRIEGVPVPIRDILDPWKCPEAFLPWLAWQRSVDIWDPAWPVMVKRQVIASSLVVHRIKGTPGAIELGLGAMDFEARVLEWWEVDIDKGRFRVEVDVLTRGLTEGEVDTIFEGVAAYKNAKSHLDLLTVRATARSALPVLACAPSLGHQVTLMPLAVTDIEAESGLPVLATAAISGSTITLLPLGAA